LKPAWHALLVPLPADAVVRRKPVSDQLPGWESLSVELSAGAAGLRHVMVTLENGTPISAGDWVMFCSGTPLEYLHESIGGRIEADGVFNGTRWRSVAVEVPGREDPETRETARLQPTREETAALNALVREIVERAGRDSR